MREFRLIMEKLDCLSTNIMAIQNDIATMKDIQRNLKIEVSRCTSSITEHEQILTQHEQRLERYESELSDVISYLSEVKKRYF